MGEQEVFTCEKMTEGCVRERERESVCVCVRESECVCAHLTTAFERNWVLCCSCSFCCIGGTDCLELCVQRFFSSLATSSLSLSPLPLSLSLSLLSQLPSQLQAILVNDHSNPRKPGLLMLAISLSFSLSSTSTHPHALTHTHTLNYSCFDEELKENGHNFRNHLPSVLREERFEESKQSQQRHRQRR